MARHSGAAAATQAQVATPPVQNAASLQASRSDTVPAAVSTLEGEVSTSGSRTALAHSKPTVLAASEETPVHRQPSAPVDETPTWQGGSDGAPSLFGTVALRVGHTPLDDKWRAIEYAGDGALPAGWAAERARLQKMGGFELLVAVNGWVNRHVAFATDEEVYGVEDHWATLSETASRGRGDCEDFAIAKLQLLKAAGVPAHDLYLVIAHDLIRRADHALLVVRLEGRFFVLDSGGSEPLSADEVQDYRPVMTFSANRAWIHGYRREPANVLVASNSR